MNELGIPTEYDKYMPAPRSVRLMTVASKRDDRLSKIIWAPFNTPVRSTRRLSCMPDSCTLVQGCPQPITLFLKGYGNCVERLKWSIKDRVSRLEHAPHYCHHASPSGWL